jgi:hypothetical protein
MNAMNDGRGPPAGGGVGFLYGEAGLLDEHR